MKKKKPVEKKVDIGCPQVPAGTKTVKTRDRKKGRAKRAATTRLSSSKSGQLTAAMVKQAALAAENMPAAAVTLNIEDLAGMLEKNAKLAKAWDRGRLLKRMAELAAAGVTIHEAAETLEMEEDKLAATLEKDKEARDVWNQARIKTIVEIKTILINQAKEGKPMAARQIERMLRRDIARPVTDFHSVTTDQLAELTGKTRQTIHAWFTQHGLPRNSDGTYDLSQFISWIEDFTIAKVNQSPGRFAPETLDPVKAKRAEKLGMEIARQKGELIDRGQVIAGYMMRHQSLVNALARKETDLAMICQGQPAEKIAQILKEFFFELRQSICRMPEELQLEPEAKNKFEELMTLLGSEREGR